jgi:hypothetical protein
MRTPTFPSMWTTMNYYRTYRVTLLRQDSTNLSAARSAARLDRRPAPDPHLAGTVWQDRRAARVNPQRQRLRGVSHTGRRGADRAARRRRGGAAERGARAGSYISATVV